MKRSERIDVVQQAAARTERERAERVGAAERHLVEMQQKLAALEKYRSEYESGFASRAGAGVDVIGMRDFQTFLARLGEALTQQRELVALARKALEAERSHWREAALRQHVVETLAERCAQILREEFGVAWLRLKLSKPGAVRGAKSVGVMLERGSRPA